jgi:DNA-binding transcriptional ArsR family regulator
MQVVDLFRALGDPTRLEMVQRLARGGNHTITSVSSNLKITRQGARKHLQILEDAKVVSLKPRGRDTEVRLLRDSLDQGRSFIANLEKKWDLRLQALRRFVENET